MLENVSMDWNPWPIVHFTNLVISNANQVSTNMYLGNGGLNMVIYKRCYGPTKSIQSIHLWKVGDIEEQVQGCSTFIFDHGSPIWQHLEQDGKPHLLLYLFNLLDLFICYKTMLGDRALNRVKFFMCFEFFAIYHTPFFSLYLGMLTRAFLLPSCFFTVSHLGCVTLSMLSRVEHTLHLNTLGVFHYP